MPILPKRTVVIWHKEDGMSTFQVSAREDDSGITQKYWPLLNGFTKTITFRGKK